MTGHAWPVVRALGVALLLALLPGAAPPARAQGMLSSKHNLSVTGPGPVKALTETQVCVFCHTPHNASPGAPLWNRDLSGQTYTPYASGTLQASVGQPNGYSRLCLSCHDGTIAVGKVRNLWGVSTTIQMAGTAPGGVMPPGRTNLGTNLTNDHPISFAFDQTLAAADGELADPGSLTAEIRLYEGATRGLRDSVQCTTCHDPHLTVYPKFLKRDQFGRTASLCLTCHVKPGWVGSSHEGASKIHPPGGTLKVSDWSCRACHDPHAKVGSQRLLREGATDAGAAALEETCYLCHKSGGTGGISYDLRTQFTDPGRRSRHPVDQFAGHEPVFTVAQPADSENPPERVLNTHRHVECTDCHNPHRVTAANKVEGMRGVDIGGTVVQDVTQNRDLAEHEVCFRCHGETYASVISSAVPGDPSGTIPTSDKRSEFQTTNSSFHPVAGAGRNTSSNLNAQLAPNGLSTTSVIRCTDCHNNDFFARASGCAGAITACTSTLTQPKGPHGSSHFNLLRARFWNVLPGPAAWSGGANFSLCFQCHDLTALTARRTGEGARTNFYDEADGKDNLHWVHLIDRIDKSRPLCKSCHYNIHSNVAAPNTQYRINGVLYPAPNATPISTTRLINFHPSVQPTGGRARPEWWFDTTTRERRCYLQCHQPSGAPGGEVMDGDDKHHYTPPVAGDIQ